MNRTRTQKRRREDSTATAIQPLPAAQKSDQYASRDEFLQRAAAFEMRRLQHSPWLHGAESNRFSRKAFTVAINPDIGLKFIRISQSSYADHITSDLREMLLGVPNRNGDLRRWEGMFDTRNGDRVTVPYDFYLSETFVTNAMFDVFARETDYRTCVERHATGWVVDQTAHWRQGFANDWRRQVMPLSEPEHPVVQVSWFDSMWFAEWLNRRTKVVFRLPTKEEWLLAARSADLRDSGCVFPWGNALEGIEKRMNFGTGELSDFAWIHDQYLDGHTYSSPVKAYPRSARGLFDVLGNVWGWNWTNPAHYDRRAPGDRIAQPDRLTDLGVDRNEHISMQGGCYLARLSHANLFSKMSHPALDGAEDIGFRLVAIRRADSGL